MAPVQAQRFGASRLDKSLALTFWVEGGGEREARFHRRESFAGFKHM